LSGGRVLNKRDAEMIAVFATADAAAAAAARMQIYSQTIPQKFAVRAAFHTGPVSQRGKEIFGDTVNLALRLVDEAKAGQVVTSGDTAQSLSPAVQESVRPLRSMTVQGTDRSLMVGKFIWRRAPAAPLSLPTAFTAPIKLKVAYGRYQVRPTTDARSAIDRTGPCRARCSCVEASLHGRETQ
jgi:class 3 adenylate cyclase